MIKYNIITGELYTDLDTPYDKEGNKIDVYTSVYWTANNEKEYNTKESIINDFRHENELFEMVAWCDVSGYDYWVVKQEEPNYVSIDVYLKKQPEQYTQEELQTISKAIIDADNYFVDKL